MMGHFLFHTTQDKKSTMARIEGAKEVQAALRKLANKAQRGHRTSVVIGYNARYALFVHENKEMKWKGLPRKGTRPDGSKSKGKYWDPQGHGQSQFLIQPFREKRKELATIIRTTYKKTKDLSLGLLLAGQKLQKESQLLVPVDLGNLKESAFTKVEKQ